MVSSAICHLGSPNWNHLRNLKKHYLKRASNISFLLSMHPQSCCKHPGYPYIYTYTPGGVCAYMHGHVWVYIYTYIHTQRHTDMYIYGYRAMTSLGNNNAIFIAFLIIVEQGYYYRHTPQLFLLYYSPKAHLPEICICKNKVPFFSCVLQKTKYQPHRYEITT